MNRNDFRTLGNLFRRNNRRTSFGMLAYVASVGPEPNEYTGRLADTQGTVSFSGPKDQTLTINQPVLLARPDIAGRMLNGGYIYLGLPPMHARNTTTSNEPDDQTETTTAEIVTSIPEYVSLDAGGDSVTIHIYGKNLSTAPTYGSADLIDASAQVITSTHITLTVRASIALDAGEYSLTVGGVTYPKFFHVSTLRPDLTDLSWQWQHGASTATQATPNSPIIMGATWLSSNAYGLRILEKAPASSSPILTVGIVPTMAISDWQRCGIFIQGQVDRCVTVGLVTRSAVAGPFLRVERWSNSGVTPTTVYNGEPTIAWTSGPIYFRIEDDGTNLKFYWSSDGVTFTQLYTETRAAFLGTPVSYGPFVYNSASGPFSGGVYYDVPDPVSMAVHKWIETP